MNLFLHNIGDIDSETLISPNDSLIAASETSYDYVLANPPFGKKSSMTFTNEAGGAGKGRPYLQPAGFLGNFVYCNPFVARDLTFGADRYSESFRYLWIPKRQRQNRG